MGTWTNGKILSTIGTNGALTEHQGKPTNVKGDSYSPRSESPRPEQLRGCIERVSIISLLRVLEDALSIPQVTTKWSDILAGAPESQEVLNANDWLTSVALDAIGEGESGLAIAS